QEAEVDAFFKEAGLAPKTKGVGFTFAKFQATAEKMASKQPKYLNLDMALRGSKPLLYYMQNSDILSRGTNLGRDMIDIVRKRENVCPSCANKEPVKVAEHTVKTFYNGHITEIWDNDKWIPDLKREKDKVKRRASNAFFNDDFFPNMLLETISNSFIEGQIRKDRKSTRLNSSHV